MEKNISNKIGKNENHFKAAIELVKDLIKDPLLLKQKKAIERIHKTLCYAAENDKNMTLKCRKLQSEISSNSSKIRAAIQLSKEDNATIAMLREELEKAWAVIKEQKISKSVTSDSDSAGDYSRKYLKEISCLKADKQNCLDEIKTLKAHLRNKEKDLECLKDENQNCSNELQNFKQLKEKEINGFKKQIQLLDDSLCEMQLEVAVSKKENDKLLSENEKYKLQVFELDEELSNKEKQSEEKKTANVPGNNESVNTGDTSDNSYLLQFETDSLSFLRENTPTKESIEIKKLKRKLKSKESKEAKLSTLYRHIKSNLILEKRQFYETMNSLNTVRVRNDLLSKELEEKSVHCTVLILENKKLRNEIRKFTLSINLLEEIRDNYVSTMGKLENETHYLKSELAKCKQW